MLVNPIKRDTGEDNYNRRHYKNKDVSYDLIVT